MYNLQVESNEQTARIKYHLLKVSTTFKKVPNIY